MAKDLSYQTVPPTEPATPLAVRGRWLIAACAVAAWCVIVIARVEYLNAQLPPGWRLPKVEQGQWRESLVVTEQWWRRAHLHEASARQDRPLSAAERATMEVEISQARADNALRSWVEGPGFLQYAFAFGLAVVGLVWAARGSGRTRAVGVLCLVVGAVALAHAWVRGLFTSLGW